MTFCIAATETALELATTIGKQHVWTHVGLAPVAANGTHLPEVHGWRW
jgi:hypothetical protein